MDYYYIWKHTVKTNIQEYIVSLQEDTCCSFILGLFLIIPFLLYVLLGCIYIILIVLPITLYSFTKSKEDDKIDCIVVEK